MKSQNSKKIIKIISEECNCLQSLELMTMLKAEIENGNLYKKTNAVQGKVLGEYKIKEKELGSTIKGLNVMLDKLQEKYLKEKAKADAFKDMYEEEIYS